MKHFVPFLALVGACSTPAPDSSSAAQDLSAIRESIEELKKSQQPKVDAEQAMEDLTKEIRRLRDRLAVPVPQQFPGGALAVLPPVHGELLTGSVGGTQQGVSDLYWVLAKVTVGGEERIALALYQASSGGRGFKLAGVRLLGPDLQIIEFGQEKPHVREIIDELKRAQK